MLFSSFPFSCDFVYFVFYFKGPTSSSSDIILTVSQQVVGATNLDKENQEKETTLGVSRLTAPNSIQNQLTTSSVPPSPHTNSHQTTTTSTTQFTTDGIKTPAIVNETNSQVTIKQTDITTITIQSQNPINKVSDKQQQKHVPTGGISNPHNKVKTRKETLEAKRERKAAKTLAIITGAFVVCWLPFFLMAIILPLCATCTINDKIAALFLWLGYFNSTLNPVIYTIFSPEFRQAFKRILFGTHRTGYYRGGKL